MTATMRCVNSVFCGPALSDTMSPALSSPASTGLMITADPSGTAGSIDPPPMMIVWRPVRGTSLPSTTPPRTTTIRARSRASRTRRMMPVARPRILSIAWPSSASWIGAWPRPVTRDGSRPAVLPGCDLRVVCGLLGGERERRRGRDTLEGIAGRDREADPEAEDLAGPACQDPVAGLGTLCRVADGRSVERRAGGDDNGAGEEGAAAADILSPNLERELAAERVRGHRRHGVAECRVAGIPDRQRARRAVTRHHSGDRGHDRRARRDVDRPGGERPCRGRRVGEERQRHGPGTERECGQGGEQRGDAASSGAPAPRPVLIQVLIHWCEPLLEWRARLNRCLLSSLRAPATDIGDAMPERVTPFTCSKPSFDVGLYRTTGPLRAVRWSHSVCRGRDRRTKLLSTGRGGAAAHRVKPMDSGLPPSASEPRPGARHSVRRAMRA